MFASADTSQTTSSTIGPYVSVCSLSYMSAYISKPPIFREVYDGRNGVSYPVENLPVLPVTIIEGQDVVLVHCRVTRYAPKESKRFGPKKFEASTSLISLELKDVVLLSKGVGAQPVQA